MMRFPLKDLRLDEKELNTDLGEGNIVFVGSSCDMWSVGVPNTWIAKVMTKCNEHPLNNYFFQSKNPFRFQVWQDRLPHGSVLCTTIETNRRYNQMGKTPEPHDRAYDMIPLQGIYDLVVTIEPIMDFDVPELVSLVKIIKPEWVNVGADSQGHKLPEPPAWKIFALIKGLEAFTKVHLKQNLLRIYE
jgi:protein gp37